MLKSYEAIYEAGQMIWLGEVPQIDQARVIVTIIEEGSPIQKKRHFPPSHLADKAKVLGDIVAPLVDEADWECLK
ncbi:MULTISPECIES: hypothetical protein [Cyanophyceae]|uniref:hypothetical protein n=1 Tax=Cyanophyceae TaxID=3028117 RepID=UPI0004AA7121|nr:MULTISPECIES: hypothetical protein [Cyanophyceae]ANV86447.1 hypothetical protein AWQ22_02620 [Picosynechococcus sp. PCC 7117]ANV89619.1 hypothetical protein AWQ24_02645 [Picosynechococcus sp. PCC 8807]QCS49129.1 hypothetical protein FEK30_06620 [Picosynechococcus sp. PCC 11901]